MSVLNVTKAALLGTVLYIPLALATAAAADLILYPEPAAEQPVDFVLPAVSGPNGKFELDIGALTDPSSAIFRAGASFTLPVGDTFGLQGDLAVGSFADEWVGGGALHAFTRDPSSYLIGVTAGVVVADGAMLGALGVEGELYLDRISLEGWAGWAALEYDDPMLSDDSGFFGIGDVAFYPTDDWRLSIGVASILGSESLKLATEYQFADLGMPFSGTGEIRAGCERRGQSGRPGQPAVAPAAPQVDHGAAVEHQRSAGTDLVLETEVGLEGFAHGLETGRAEAVDRIGDAAHADDAVARQAAWRRNFGGGLEVTHIARPICTTVILYDHIP